MMNLQSDTKHTAATAFHSTRLLHPLSEQDLHQVAGAVAPGVVVWGVVIAGSLLDECGAFDAIDVGAMIEAMR
jgi:hypothetical protein